MGAGVGTGVGAGIGTDMGATLVMCGSCEGVGAGAVWVYVWVLCG